MKLFRDWLTDYVDLTGISDAELAERFTNIGHAVDSIEKHDDDVVFDLEITTNRVDAMSHLGMARELAAALGREVMRPAKAGAPLAPHGAPPKTGQTIPTTSHGAPASAGITIRIEAPEMCARF